MAKVSTAERAGLRSRAVAWAPFLLALCLAAAFAWASRAQEAPSVVERAYGWRLAATDSLGVAVTIADADGAAAAAGVETGDVIMALDGAPPADVEALSAALANREPGEIARLLVMRGDSAFEVELLILSAGKPRIFGSEQGGESVGAEGTAPELIGAPELVLDTGGHSGQVEDAVFTADGAYLITAGEDKTIRVWDWREGRTVRILRGAIGRGGEGKILALALSPDGDTLAVAGRLDPDSSGGAGFEDGRIGEYVRLFSLETGEVIGRVGDVPEVIVALSFTPDGGGVVTGAISGDVALWDVETGDRIRSFSGHQGDVYDLGFTPDGERLISADTNGVVIVWNAESGAAIGSSRAATTGVYAIAISPRGDLFATGELGGPVRLWSAVDGSELRLLDVLESSVGALAFTRDGAELIVGCAGNDCGNRPRVYDVETRELLRSIGGHSNVVIATATHPAGRLVATAGGDNFEIQIWDYETGGVVSRLEGSGGSVWSTGFSRDGTRIGWGRSVDLTQPDRPTQRPIEFAFPLPQAGGVIREPERIDDPEEFIGERRVVGSRQVTVRPGGPENLSDAVAEISDNGVVIGVVERRPVNGFEHRSVTLTPDGEYLFSGGSNGVLEKYAANGVLIGELIGHTSDVWSVSVSPDGRLVVSSSADQTVRIWNAETLELIVTIFQSTDGRWIMWTPQGYYDGSPDAGEMIGWALGRGLERSALYVSASQLGTTLYRPRLAARAIELGSAEAAVEEALREQSELREEDRGPNFRPLPSNVAELLRQPPPTIREIAVLNVLPDGHAMITLVVRPNGAEIDALDAFVGDRSVTAEEAVTPLSLFSQIPLAEDETLITWRVALASGRNEVALRARSVVGASELTDRIVVDLPDQFTGALDTSGKLRVLAVGVDNYDDSSFYNLRFASADARAFADLVSQVMAPDSGEVEVRLLTNGADDDGEPTREEIEAALDWIAESEDGDTTVLFIAGHGDAANGDFFFLPTDFSQSDPTDFGEGRLPWATVRDALERTRGRKIVFLDACRSGISSYYEGLESDARRHRYVAFNSTSTDERGVPQFAYEDPALGHGVFTYAVLQGMRGGAFPANSERLTAFNLMSFISSEVYDLSRGRQAPSLGGSGNFLLLERNE